MGGEELLEDLVVLVLMQVPLEVELHFITLMFVCGKLEEMVDLEVAEAAEVEEEDGCLAVVLDVVRIVLVLHLLVEDKEELMEVVVVEMELVQAEQVVLMVVEEQKVFRVATDGGEKAEMEELMEEEEVLFIIKLDLVVLMLILILVHGPMLLMLVVFY